MYLRKNKVLLPIKKKKEFTDYLDHIQVKNILIFLKYLFFDS